MQYDNKSFCQLRKMNPKSLQNVNVSLFNIMNQVTGGYLKKLLKQNVAVQIVIVTKPPATRPNEIVTYIFCSLVAILLFDGMDLVSFSLTANSKI